MVGPDNASCSFHLKTGPKPVYKLQVILAGIGMSSSPHTHPERPKEVVVEPTAALIAYAVGHLDCHENEQGLPPEPFEHHGLPMCS